MRSRHHSGIWFVRVVLILSTLIAFATASYAKLSTSEDGRRLALVIGNSDYTSLPPLKNAAGDAKLVADSLAKVGFTVELLTNASLDRMKAAIDQMANGADPSDHVVFYYSGHGFQLDGINYIVPVDAALKSKDVIDSQTVRLNEAISKLQAGGRQTMAFIDACRDNPLPPSVRGDQTVNGLAKLGDGVAQNLYVAFATAPGSVSLDGAGDHGPFATALAANLQQPQVPIYLMMNTVRRQVLDTTGNQQNPTVEESLRDAFYFNGEPGGLTFGGGATTQVANALPLGRVIDGNPPPTLPTAPTQANPGTIVIATADPTAPPGGQRRDVPTDGLGVLNPSGIGNVDSAPTKPPVAVNDDPAKKPTDSNSGVQQIDASTSSVPSISGTDISDGTDVTDGTEVSNTSDSGGSNGPGQPTTTENPQVAILEPNATPTLTPESPSPALILQIQAELSRLSCLKGAVDGAWDADSKSALQAYFKVKKVASIDPDLTVDLYNALHKEPSSLCVATGKKPPDIRKPHPPKPVVEAQNPTVPSRPRPQPVPQAPANTPSLSTSNGFKPTFGSGSFR